MSGVFRKPNMSVDVASLAPLIESRDRFPDHVIATVPCKWFISIGHPPHHDPLPDNLSHAIVPDKLTKLHARETVGKIKSLEPALTP